ncbi:hypothetical protein ACA910_019692 [Epithemia clementina (nom. ined.)]
MQLLQMHAKFCALNGIHAASCTCRSMVEYLDGLIPPTSETAAEDANPQHNSKGEEEEEEEEGYITAPLSAEDAKATAMIQLAQEELFRFMMDLFRTCMASDWTFTMNRNNETRKKNNTNPKFMSCSMQNRKVLLLAAKMELILYTFWPGTTKVLA